MKLIPTLTCVLSNMICMGSRSTRTLILLNIASHPEITYQGLTKTLKKGGIYIEISSVLDVMRKAGHIKTEGTARQYRYILTEKGEQICKELLTLRKEDTQGDE